MMMHEEDFIRLTGRAGKALGAECIGKLNADWKRARGHLKFEKKSLHRARRRAWKMYGEFASTKGYFGWFT
jgi:hypothetical protein